MDYYLEIKFNKQKIFLFRIYDIKRKSSYSFIGNPIYKSCYFKPKLKDKLDDLSFERIFFEDLIPINENKFNKLLDMKINKIYKFNKMDLLKHLDLQEWVI